VDSLGVEFSRLLSVVAEGVGAAEVSSESLGGSLEVVGEGAEVIDLPSEELFRTVNIGGLSSGGVGLNVTVVLAALAPFADEGDGVSEGAHSLLDSAKSSGVVDEIGGGGGVELGDSGKDVGLSLTSDVDAGEAVSLETVVASARLGTVVVVGARGIGGAWVGEGATVRVAEVGAVDIGAKVEVVVASARVVVLVVGAGGVALAWISGARVDVAGDSVSVEAVVAVARPLSGSVDWELDSAGSIGGAVVGAAASVWDAVGSISVEVEEASAAGADGGTGDVGAVSVGGAWVGVARVEVAGIGEAGAVSVGVELFDGLEVVVVVARAGSGAVGGDAAGSVGLAGGVSARVVDAGADLSVAVGVEVEVAGGALADEVPASSVGAVGVVAARLPAGNVVLGDHVVVLVLQDGSNLWGVGARVLSSDEITLTAGAGG